MKRTKTIFAVILAILMVFSVVPVMAADPVRIEFNGNVIQFDPPLRLVQDRILAPVSPFAAAIDARVNWDGETRTATIIRGDTAVALRIDDARMTVLTISSGQQEVVTLPLAPRIYGGSTFMPIEQIAIALGLNTNWDNAARMLRITTPGFVPSEVVDGGTQTTITPPQGGILTPTQLPTRSLDVANHTIPTEFNGSFTASGQRDEFRWTAPSTAGTAFFGITGLSIGNVDVFVFNSSGTQVASNTWITNNGGVMVTNLVRGETYTLQVRQRTGLSHYTLNVVWKETVDVSSITEIADDFRFSGQRNNYSWTAPSTSGGVFFGITGLSTGNLDLHIFNAAGTQVASNTWVANSNGVMITNLVAGETYTIQVRQRTGLSPYTLNIVWKEMMNVSNVIEIADNFRFSGQRNNYSWTSPSVNGAVFFGITGLSTGNLDIHIFNSAGTQVASNTWVVNNNGVRIDNLVAGETYHIQVRQRTGLSPYSLNIDWKETLNISGRSEVQSNLRFSGQRNFYTWTAPSTGSVSFNITELSTGNVDIHVFNSAGTQVASRTWVANNNGVTVNNLIASETYTIQVRQRTGLSSYTLTIR